MKKLNKFWGIIVIGAVIGFFLAGCGDSGSGDPTSPSTPGTPSGGGGKVTITLSAGSGTGNIKLKLSEGTWNTSGSWDATQSSNLNGIMSDLLTISSNELVSRSNCTATVIESNTALNIELKNSSGLLAVSGDVQVKATLNPVEFPYTSHGGVSSLSEKFQVAGDPVSFVNKTRLYADISTPWANGTREITISESVINFSDTASSSYVYAYNIDTWKSDYVGGRYCVTIDVSNGRKTSGAGSLPSSMTGKTSFTIDLDDGRFVIKQVNGGTFSETSWNGAFTK